MNADNGDQFAGFADNLDSASLIGPKRETRDRDAAFAPSSNYSLIHLFICVYLRSSAVTRFVAASSPDGAQRNPGH
jgi:hypothetical protein